MDRGAFIILLVDDEEGLLEGLKKTLSFKGYSVITASTGFQAIRIINNNRYLQTRGFYRLINTSKSGMLTTEPSQR